MPAFALFNIDSCEQQTATISFIRDVYYSVRVMSFEIRVVNSRLTRKYHERLVCLIDWSLPEHIAANNLTHWGRVTHICVSKLTIIALDNGLSPGRRQAIIWTSAGILLIGPLGTNFSEILIEIITFSFKKIPFKVSSGKWRIFCLGLNVLLMNVIAVM